MPPAIIQDGMFSTGVVTVLYRVLAGALRDGELVYLESRTICIQGRDMSLTFYITLQQGRLVTSRATSIPDLPISGTLHACLLLVARGEDTDALFFQRRLRMACDTEPGLEVKNYLDGLYMGALVLPKLLGNLAQKALPLSGNRGICS
jgi:predicted lipid carrier protein YhbT